MYDPIAAPTSLSLVPAATPALSFGAKPAGALALGTPAKAPLASAPVPSMLAGKSLDEIVNHWSGELEERTRDFAHIAGEVREWDRLLRDNGEQVRPSLSLDYEICD